MARLLILLLLFVWSSTVFGQVSGAGYALRFYGNGVNDIDRVKIQIDDPANGNPGPPADVGATDFTIEFWMRAQESENPAPAIRCGANVNWIYGNIVFDRDRYNQDRKFGLSIAGGRFVFGVSGDGTGDLTICGKTNVLDMEWHHVAVQRRRSDGWMWLYVDGILDAQGDGPDGDIDYPDNGIPGNFCNGPCTNSDLFLVIGAEKHDAGPLFLSFSGWIDEIRLSNVLRYSDNSERPSAPFTSDVNTVALYHFDEGSGDIINDTSAALGGPSNGVRRFGGNPPGPVWVVSDAPLNGISSVASTVTVTFDNPAPSGTSGSFLNGIFQGINFGTNQWIWEDGFGPDTTRHIFFGSASGTSRTFTFAPGPRTLVSINVFAPVAGTLTLTDNLGQTRVQAIATGSMQVVTTGWTQASTTMTVNFTRGWELGVDDIVYQ